MISHPRPAVPRRPGRLLPAVLVPVLALCACATTVTGAGSRVGGGTTDLPSSSPSPSSGSSGSASPSASGTAAAKDLVDAMETAMDDVDSGFTITGQFDDSDGDSGFDLRVQGDKGTGSMTIGGSVCQIVGLGGDTWADAPAAFWTDEADVDSDVAARIAGKWVEATGDIGFLSAFASQGDFLDVLLSDIDDYDLESPTTIDGQDVSVVDADDEMFSIASKGEPLLLRIGDGDVDVDVTFPSDALTVTAPPSPIPYPGQPDRRGGVTCPA